MTDRHTVNTITSDALDALYEQLEAAEDSESQRQLATSREALASSTVRAARAEHELAALRQVARGYCPACGRGDAAPTVEDWEQQRDRADQAEPALLEARQHLANAYAQRDRLRIRMNRLADRWDLEGPPPGNRPLTELRAEISVAPLETEETAAPPEPGLYDKIAAMFSGPLPWPPDAPPATAIPCNHAHLRQPHAPHAWQPQPGMRHVQCPGHTRVPADTDTTKEN